MSLNSLYLFSNVRITPDYSVVHDMDPGTWRDFLLGQLDPMPPGADHDTVYVNTQKLNYYRMPDVIRIEGNYDRIKKATYGLLQDGMWNDQQPAHTSFRYVFFWVKNVRLITQRVNDHTEGAVTVFDDVVELELEMDTWSTYGIGAFSLYDSFVERRHMDRWVNKGTDLVPDWQPVYYPNAGQGVEGAYEMEDSKDITTPQYTGGKHVDPRYIIVFAIKTSGEACLFIGMDAYVQEDDAFQPVYRDHAQSQVYFGLEDILDGSFYGAAGANITADLVQSIVVVPSLRSLQFAMRIPSGQTYIEIDETLTQFSGFTSHSGSSGLSWLDVDFSIGDMRHLMQKVTVGFGTIIAPDHNHQIANPDYDPSDPDSPQYLDDYDEEHEPMMYYSPARTRKVVTSFGGEVFAIPDIKAFEKSISYDNIFDMTGAVVYVYSGTDLKTANAVGAVGVLEAATLPIHNSAWKSYEAINKVGDEIAYNAKQFQTVANGITGTASSSIMGGFVGGPFGAVMGLISGSIGTAAGYHGNEEELRAKQVTIKNSPCNVKSGGSGLGAYAKGLTDVYYITLKMDDQSMEKLRFMYYWYGYHVNRMFKGDIDLHTRSKFDYIKTNGAKVKGDLTAGAAKQIAGIFDAGVTIYHGTDGYLLIGTGDMKENDEV